MPDTPHDVIAHWQAVLETTKSIPLIGQEQLRELLIPRTVLSSEMRDRITGLLNPRKAKVIELSEQRFQQVYSSIREDNFRPPSEYFDKKAPYDAVHGYYVMPRFDDF